MKFDPKSQIGGYPAVDVRVFLRKVSSAHLGFSAKDAQSVAQLSKRELERFLKCLAGEDLLERFLLLNGQKDGERPFGAMPWRWPELALR